MSEAKTDVLNMRVLPVLKGRLAVVARKENMSLTEVAECFLAYSLSQLWKMRDDEGAVYLRSCRLARSDFYGIQSQYEKETAIQDVFSAALGTLLQNSPEANPTSEEIVREMEEADEFDELKQWLLLGGPSARRDFSPLATIVANAVRRLDEEGVEGAVESG